MADFNEDDHPRDQDGKFSYTGSKLQESKPGAKTREEHQANARAHDKASREELVAAQAHRAAAERTKDPVQRADHLAKAQMHTAKAAQHQRERESSKAKANSLTSTIGKWAARRVAGYHEFQEKLLHGSPGEVLHHMVDKVAELPGNLIPGGGAGAEGGKSEDEEDDARKGQEA